MDSNNQYMGILSVNLADLGLLDDCSPSSVPAASPLSIGHDVGTFEQVFLAEQAMDSNSYSFPGTGLDSITWDHVPSKQQQEQRQLPAFLDPYSTSSMGYTPELSPSMSYATPAVNTVKSPYGFDTLGLDELGASPSVGYQTSPVDEVQSFGSQQSVESFDFDFRMTMLQNDTAAWCATQTDFDLFPDNAATTVTSLEQLLMAPVPNEAAATLSAILEEASPIKSEMDYFSPLTLASSSPATSDYDGLFDQPSACEGAPASGYRPPKRRRPCRKSTEEACRVESASEDPKVKDTFRCEICNKDFTRAFNLRSHRSTHTGVKPFACTLLDDNGEPCNRPFARRHDLERHVRSIHSKLKLFKCKTCGRECGRTDAFKRHLQRHPLCGQAAQKELEEKQEPQ
ncbi:hypothetical protein BGZ75_010234 [Mortierella antarctica]|nr:hypothetical protein BGZ75_010234 [Mortierella antarctica]